MQRMLRDNGLARCESLTGIAWASGNIICILSPSPRSPRNILVTSASRIQNSRYSVDLGHSSHKPVSGHRSCICRDESIISERPLLVVPRFLGPLDLDPAAGLALAIGSLSKHKFSNPCTISQHIPLVVKLDSGHRCFQYRQRTFSSR